ncbi:MAG: tetratricopeptide repeat protein [Pasteurellaceae bacterium]|nr:tetratricopeptide repeat protein [Pasteurellaceae bacterium]
MSYNIFKKTAVCGLAILISACSSLQLGTQTEEALSAKEKLYHSVKNYNGLISLYRDALKKNDEPELRYKLANSYYQAGDSQSSLLYLKPLLTRQDKIGENALLLEVKNNIQLSQYKDAMKNINVLLQRIPNNGEAYNLRGIIFAQEGNLQEAFKDITRARELFINDVIAINNLAMLSIINGDYKNASSLLLPQYLNGSRDYRVMHNLVFALVKSGEVDYALDIIKKERLNTNPEDLVNALKKTERLPKVSK